MKQTQKKGHVTDPIFIDDSFIMYTPPKSSTVWSRLGLQHAACVQQELEQQEETPLPEPQLETH
jgi:hypothetical protein